MTEKIFPFTNKAAFEWCVCVTQTNLLNKGPDVAKKK